MLTGDLLRASLLREKGGRTRVRPRYVGATDPELLALAAELVAEVQAHVGKSRGELRAALEGRARAGDRVRLERGLAKLLADRSEFERSSELDPEAARACVFARAAEARRAGAFDRERVLAEAASALAATGSLSLTARDVEGALDADRKTRERLLRFEPLEPAALLERYDVALAQAVLLRAVRVTVTLEARPARVRTVLRAIKFRQLLFAATRSESPKGVRLDLDGPLSLFESSTKYGLNLAAVLPAILLCEKFSLEAELAWGSKRTRKHFVLTEADGLRSPATDHGAAPPPELEAFARRFEEVARGWKVTWDAAVSWIGGQAVVPDLGFVHEASGLRGALELIASARKGSLPGRLAALHEHARPGLVVAVARNLVAEGAVLPPGVVLYRSMPSAEEVKAELERALSLA